MQGVPDLQEEVGAGGDEEEACGGRRCEDQGGQRGGHEPPLRFVRRGVFRDVHELHGRPLLLSCLPSAEHWSVRKLPCKESPIYKATQEIAARKKTLAEQEQALGVDHEETLSTVNDIGFLLREQGKIKEAEVFLRRALEVRERTLGGDHRHTLTSFNNLGVLLKAQGKLTLAEPFYRRAFEGREQTLGRDRHLTLQSVNNLGMLLQAQGKLGLVEPFYRRALEGRERTIGRDHPDALLSVNITRESAEDYGDGEGEGRGGTDDEREPDGVSKNCFEARME